MKNLIHHTLFLLVVLCSCTTVQHISKVNTTYVVPGGEPAVAPDESVVSLIAPYKLQLDARMNEVIATLGTDLVKRQPESTMGNWYSDAMLWGANQGGFKADFAITNYGGMRVPMISAGLLTVGELYELSPFDNMLLIVDVPGNVVDTLFRYIASRDGWPVSKNVRLVVNQKNLVSATIDGNNIDPTKIYKVAVPDYVANGGDDARFMIPLSRVSTEKMQRNILIDYAKQTASEGKTIYTSMEGRIVNQ